MFLTHLSRSTSLMFLVVSIIDGITVAVNFANRLNRKVVTEVRKVTVRDDHTVRIPVVSHVFCVAVVVMGEMGGCGLETFGRARHDVQILGLRGCKCCNTLGESYIA